MSSGAKLRTYVFPRVELNLLLYFYPLHILRHLHIPSQFFFHPVAKLRRSGGLAVDKVGRTRLVLKRPQPLLHLWRIGMIAELFKRRDLRADGHELAEDLHLGRPAFDKCTAR